jgi:transcriptional regulator with XRE-family HTH domain
MLDSRLMRAARALTGWEQSDLAEAAGISIATVRKIEQGAIGTRPSTEARIVAAFERAGLQLIPEGPDGGAGVRWKEREMTEQMRECVELKNKIKGFFIYNLGRKDNEDLDAMVDEVAFAAIQPHDHLKETLTRWSLSELPAPLVADLEKLGDMEMEIGTQQEMEWQAQQKDDDENEYQEED